MKSNEVFDNFAESMQILYIHKGAFTYDVRFLGRQVGRQVGQAVSDFTKQAYVVK